MVLKKLKMGILLVNEGDKRTVEDIPREYKDTLAHHFMEVDTQVDAHIRLVLDRHATSTMTPR